MIMFLLIGKKDVPETVMKADNLARWVTNTIGMANLAAQLYIHHYEYVS